MAKSETPQKNQKAAEPVATETTSVESSAPSAPAKKSNKTLLIVIGVVVFFFVVVPALVFGAGVLLFNKSFGSQKATDKTIESLVEKATDGKVDIDSDNGNFSVSGENGDSTYSVGDNQKLPDDFPKDKIPYITEKSVSFVFTNSNEGKKSWSVTTTVDKSFEDAKTYFTDKIKEPEFTSVSSYSFGDSQTLYGQNDMYDVSVTVTKPESGDTSVTYIITSKN